VPYLSASAVVIHYEEALYQVYAPLPLPFCPVRSTECRSMICCRRVQPKVNHNEWRLLYFISFLLLVAFFVLNMFVGVVVENFHKCRESQEHEEDKGFRRRNVLYDGCSRYGTRTLQPRTRGEGKTRRGARQETGTAT